MYTCYNCGYLDKNRKNKTENIHFQYGCNYRGIDKYICGWCKSDSDLKNSCLGCSNWIPMKQENSFLKGLAKKFEVLVCGERNENHITYQYSEEQFLKEFSNNNFSNPNYGGDIVENFYYKGNLVTNFKMFPGTYGTESETIYDVINYIMKKQLTETWNSKQINTQNIAERIFLKVANVRVERLQNMKICDIEKEGTNLNGLTNGPEKIYAFAQLWDSTVKKSDLDRYGWDANPWVWIIEFEWISKEEAYAENV